MIDYLTTLPGIGWIVASHWVALLRDWREIQSLRQIAGFLGLVSAEESTGDQVARGPIRRTGDNRLRNKLIQSAWTAVRKEPELRQFYRRIYSRHPKPLAAHKAIVAMARKLLTCFDPGGDSLPKRTPRHAAERPGETPWSFASGGRGPGAVCFAPERAASQWSVATTGRATHGRKSLLRSK